MRTRTITFLALLGTAVLSSAGAAAPGDTVADRVLGQGNLRSSAPYFVDGRVFGATAVAFDRSSVPNRVYVADAESNRVLGWADERGFLRGAPADLVLGQPDLLTGGVTFDPLSSLYPCARPSATTLCYPSGVAVDRAGNLYVADQQNFRVLEFDRPFGSDRRADRIFGQPDLSSRLDFLHGGLAFPEIALDPDGNLFILETRSSARLLAYANPVLHDTRPDAVVEGAAEEACRAGTEGRRLCAAAGLAVDPAGTLYVLDYDLVPTGPSPFSPTKLLAYRHPLAQRLQRSFTLVLDPNQGSLPAGGGLATDDSGSLYLLSEACIGRIAAPIGAGSELECAVALSGFTGFVVPTRLAFDTQGRLFAAQFYLPGVLVNQVLKFEPPLMPARLPQIVSSPRRTPRSLRGPLAVAVDRSSTPNHLYATDSYQRVLGWRDAEGFASGAPADLVIGGRGPRIPESQGGCAAPAADRLCSAGGLAVDGAGNLYVAEARNHRVTEFDRPFDTDAVADRVIGQGGSFTTNLCNKGGISAASLCGPWALAIDRQDNLYVADLDNFRVLLFRDPLHTDAVADRVFGQPSFTVDTSFGVLCPRPTASNLCLGELNANHGGVENPAAGLAVDAAGNLYVADGGRHRVLIFERAAASDALPATADHVLGQLGSFRTDTPGTSDRSLAFPSGLALGPRGELYVADTWNNRVLEFDRPLASDVADRVFGQPDFTSGFFAAAPPTATSLQFPKGVAVDDAGDLFVADTVHHRVVAYDQP